MKLFCLIGVILMVLIKSPYSLSDKWFYISSIPMAIGYAWMTDIIATIIETFISGDKNDTDR